MNLLSIPSFLRWPSRVPKQVISPSWDDRQSVLRPDINLYCWKRQANPAIVSFLEQVIQKAPPRINLPIDAPNLRAQLQEAQSLWLGTSLEGSRSFWEDIHTLAHDFLYFSEKNSGTLHLRVVDNDACTKFHLDGYDLRLFTTYLGPGTEWLPEKALNRSGLGKTNHDIVRDPTQIRRMQPFEVGILKGEVPAKVSPTRGIVHRSPPIQHLNLKRVILRIDI